MSLDMDDFIDPDFESTPDGGVSLITQEPGGYTGAGGTWESGATTEDPLTAVNIQPASQRTAQFYVEHGGTVSASDLRVVHINDGTMLYPDDDGTFAQLLRFSDGTAVRDWRVREADNRPWRNFCKAVVERYRGEA
jgi:hypothetical protein